MGTQAQAWPRLQAPRQALRAASCGSTSR